MEFTQGAKSLIEKNIRDIMDRMTLSQKDRADVEKELRSSFFEGAEAKAKERGATAVAEEDVLRATNEEGSPEEIAAAYMSSYADSMTRAGFWWRLLAFIIDMVVTGITIGILASPFWIMDLFFQSYDSHSWVQVVMAMMNLAISIVGLGVLLCYFVILEGRYGMTIGKYVCGMKTIRIDGTPIDFKDALLRNIPKFFLGTFIVIDALIMVIFFNKEKQRGFDKVANTIVVHTRG